jgi:hypothetical protein
MTDTQVSTWAICKRVADPQALLHDHLESGRFTADEVVRKLGALMKKEGLLRAMWVAISRPTHRHRLPLLGIRAVKLDPVVGNLWPALLRQEW